MIALAVVIGALGLIFLVVWVLRADRRDELRMQREREEMRRIMRDNERSEHHGSSTSADRDPA